MDHYEHESTTTSTKHTINTRRLSRPALGSRQTSSSSNSSITSNSSTTMTTSSSFSSTRSPSSSGKTIKQALSRLSPVARRRRKSAEATRPEPTPAAPPPRTISAPLPRPYHISFDEGTGADIHPYDFFQASLHMGEDCYTVLEDGWLRLRSGGR